MNRTTKSVVYISAALGMLLYAVPQLSIGGGWTMPTLFGVCWILFALLVIGSHLYTLLRVNEEKAAQLERVKSYRRKQLRALIERSIVHRGN